MSLSDGGAIAVGTLTNQGAFSETHSGILIRTDAQGQVPASCVFLP